MRGTIFAAVISFAVASASACAAVGSVKPDSETGTVLLQQGIGLMQRGQFQQAHDVFSRAVTLSPDNAMAWKALADANWMLGHCDVALDSYARSIKLNDRFPETFSNRGYCNIVLGHHAEAAADFQEAIKQRPDYAEAYNGLGHAHNEMKLYAAAVADLTKAIELKPDYALAISNRGWSYNGLEQNEAALADFRHALQLDPKYTLPYRGLMIVHQRMGDHAAQLEDLDHWVGDDKSNPVVQNARCWIRTVYNIDLDTALAACDDAVKLAPKQAAFLDSRAFVHFRRGEWRDAVADADAALAINAKSPGTLFVRGLAKKKLGNTAGSNADIVAAIAIDPGVVVIYAGYNVRP